MGGLRRACVRVEVASFDDGTKTTIESAGEAGLRIAYDIVRTADPRPNDGSVMIVNLDEKTRKRLAGSVPGSRLLVIPHDEAGSPYATDARIGEVPEVIARRYRYAYVTLSAGYDGVLSQIHEGCTSQVRDRNPSGLAWETSLVMGDGDAQLTHAAVNRTFESGSSVFECVDHLRRTMGLVGGNVDRKTWDSLDVFEERYTGGQYLATSWTPQGDPAKQLDLFLAAYGLRWWVDQGSMWIVGRSGYLPGPVVELGVPRMEPEDTEEGILVQVQHNPRIRPGVRARVDSRRTGDVWFVDAVRYSGDSHGELTCEVELVPITPVIGG